MPQIWVLVLLCNCAQPTQTLFPTHRKCDEAGRRALYALDINVPSYRCTAVVR